MMSEAQQKGDALELAVHAIENAILRQSPSYSDKTFRIHSKKVVTINDVRHEVDIWVTVDLAPGYDAHFIFECKNWQDKVGKNEIIVFIEKVRAVQAQRGFFVARSFTADAEAQAKLEPRIALLRVTNLPSEDIPVPLGFHGLSVEARDVQVTFCPPGNGAPTSLTPVNPAIGALVIDGAQTSIAEYVGPWIAEERKRRSNAFPSGLMPPGEYLLPFEGGRVFDKPATLDGQPIGSALIRGTVKATIVRPVVTSHFQVGTRGRALTVTMDLVGAQVVTAFAAMPDCS